MAAIFIPANSFVPENKQQNLQVCIKREGLWHFRQFLGRLGDGTYKWIKVLEDMHIGCLSVYIEADIAVFVNRPIFTEQSYTKRLDLCLLYRSAAVST